MTTIVRGLMAAFGLTLMTAACGSSDTPAPDGPPTNEDLEPIQRKPTPVTEFTPVELEATVDDFIAELNKHPHKQMHADILLKVVIVDWVADTITFRQLIITSYEIQEAIK